MSLISASEYMRYIRASAGRAGLNVVWEPINKPRHDGKTIYLPAVTEKTTESDLQQLRSSVDHEVAHDKFSDFKIMEDNKLLLDGVPILMFVWNFLEDSRINTLEGKEYRGFRDLWDITTAELLEGVASNFKRDPGPLADLLSAMIIWESEINKDLYPITYEAAKLLFKPQEKILKMLEEYTEDLTTAQKTANKIRGSKMTFDLAKKILNIDEETEKKIVKEQEEKKGKGKGKGEGAGGSKKGKGESGEGTIEEVKKYEATDEFGIRKIKVTKEDMDKYSMSIPHSDGKMSHTGTTYDVDDSMLDWDTPWFLTDIDKFIVVDYPKGEGPKEHFVTTYVPRFLDAYHTNVGSKLISEENFASQVRRLIQIRARVQTQYGVKKGKLDQARLSRICFNAPGLNERVFKNKITNTTLDAAVTVLVDMSGSMGGIKVYSALGAALLMNEVCTTLNIPIEILGFTDDYISGSYENAYPLMYVYKGFNNLRVSQEDFKSYLAMSSSHMTGNPDGENIVWAHDRLIKRKEKNRILIVMSDGNPAATRAGSGIIPFTAKVIKEIEQAGKIFIYGLGLQSRAVESFYKFHSVVNKAEEIPHKLLQLFEERIIKS